LEDGALDCGTHDEARKGACRAFKAAVAHGQVSVPRVVYDWERLFDEGGSVGVLDGEG
jgi:hypothetical protein